MQGGEALMRYRVRGSGSGVRGWAWLLLLGALITAFAPQPAEAQEKIPGGYSPSINADGTRIAFGSYYDLTGDNLLGNGHIFLWISGSGITGLSNDTRGYDSEFSINADGTKIAFVSDGGLTVGNPDGNYELFLWTQGVGLTQLTNTTGYKIFSNPSISADGTRIAFVSSADLTPGVPGNADGNTELFLWTQGVGFTQLTNTASAILRLYSLSISADGRRVAFAHNADLAPGAPGNADGNLELFLWTEGVGITQLTNTTGGGTGNPSISSDGTRIAFVSSADLTPGVPGNADGNTELFLWTQGVGFTQLTNTTGVYLGGAIPSISSDGTRIAFASSADLTPGVPGNADGNTELFLWTQGVGFTQLTNTTWPVQDAQDYPYLDPSINSDGTRIAFSSTADLTPGVPGNADGNTELFLWTQGVGFTQLTNTIDPYTPVLLSPSTEATGVSITPTFLWSGVTTGANRYWLMVAPNLADLPTDPNATSCPNCVISGSTDATSYAAPHTFPFGGRSGTLSVNTTYYWKVQAWNTNGTNGNYSTASRFTTAQPEATTPPPRPDIPADPPVPPTLGGKAVVTTHGWNSDASTWVAEMAGAICKKLGWNGSLSPVIENGAAIVCQINGWDVWVYDWRTLAAKGTLQENVGGYLRIPSDAFTDAMMIGEALAITLKRENYQHIHFVAHSAGANLIETATRWLRVWKLREGRPEDPPLTIHETFLDAYDPGGELSLYGTSADWADNYVDTRNVSPLGILDGTKLFLRNAYSIDVTSTVLELCGPICRHSRPYRFYGLSILNDGSFVGDAGYKQSDPIDSTAGMGYPLSVENGHTLEFLGLNRPRNKKCVVQGGLCYADALPPSFVQFLWPSSKEVAVQAATTAVDIATGAGNYISSLIKIGWAWIPSLAPQQRLAAMGSATSAATTEEPSYLVVNVTTSTPVNTLRFNWSFDAAGEGLLRVFVGGNLVREIDQRHVTPSSPATEEVYIGGDGVPLPAGTHRITFRLDGFGASASGVELTDVELGLLAVVNPTLTVAKAGTGTGTVTSAPAGIDCGATCSGSFTRGTPVTLTATPATGSTFVGWGGDCAADGTVTLNADKTCTATFNLITYTLTVAKAGTGGGTVTSSPPGINCGATCGTSFTSGTPVTLTATPATGSSFTGWSGACDSTGHVTLDTDKSCTATFNLTNGPDLTGTWNSLSQSCRTKLGVQTCTLRGQVTVSNQGNAPAPAASVLSFFLSSDGTTQETLLTQVAVNTLSVGRTKRARLRVPLPADTTATGKFVLAVVDTTNVIAETVETNNVIVFGPIP